jgi:hypothetical protein
MKWEACRRNKTWCHLRYSVTIYLVWLRITMKGLDSLRTQRSQTVNHKYIPQHSSLLMYRITMVWLERFSNENKIVYRLWYTDYKNMINLYAHPFTHDNPNALSYVYSTVLVKHKCAKILIHDLFALNNFNKSTHCSQNTHNERSFTACSIWSLIFSIL